ncbi:MAG: Sapep family Mn(2+)-dependent dipeptidase [Bacillota bacterium]|nr:Sapep family Mn(2+)-dependent dipeptidase [Bacillota bacterium]
MNTNNIELARVDRLIDELMPHMTQHLCELIAFPSVREEPRPRQPFGRPIGEALDYCLRLCEQSGLATTNVDGYAGFADISGSSDDYVAVLSHVDVVPATPEEWRHHPYQPVIEQGRIYGRGAIDDKGPLIASLFAGIALRECGMRPNKTLRFIFGCDEESDFACVRHYVKHYPQPVCGFTPDGFFPLVIGEKGNLIYRLSALLPEEEQLSAAPRLTALTAGNASNSVPAQAEATFIESVQPLPTLSLPAGVTLSRQEQRLTIRATGVAAHASMPQQGKNAILLLLEALFALDYQPRALKHSLDRLYCLLGGNGHAACAAFSGADELSSLTHVPSLLNAGERSFALTCDIRFPVSHDCARYQRQLDELARAEGWDIEYLMAIEPLYRAADDPLAATLLRAYRDICGGDTAPLIVGSGTYAKELHNTLAFGPSFIDAPFLAHHADEYISSADLQRLCKIYARAIYELVK